MKNFQGIVFIWTWTCSEIFKSVLVWAPGCTNRLDQNFNIIALVTIIMMLLWLYCSIFRTHAYLMPEIYSKPCQLFKIYLRHIENLGMVRTVYSGICRHVQEYSAIFNHIEAFPAFFENHKKSPDFEKRPWLCSSLD